MTLRVTIAAALFAAAIGLVACGGDDDPTSAGRAAPPASDFPDANGHKLLQVLNAADGEGPVISPSGTVYTEGDNRYAFGVFDTGGAQITDADVALYTALGKNGAAEGPFQSKTTALDPNSAKVAYVTHMGFDQPGEWRIGALVKSGDSYQASLVPSAVVGSTGSIPQVGDKAPVTHTTTADEVSDLAQIDTRDPHSTTMHEDDLADVLGKEPVVLLFASPALCRSRSCGPVVDIA